jgi:hypothetical protein
VIEVNNGEKMSTLLFAINPGVYDMTECIVSNHF